MTAPLSAEKVFAERIFAERIFAERIFAERIFAGYWNRPVLKDISLSIQSGELVALIGPNGSGKTTLLKTMAGLIKPASGRVLVGGKDIALVSRRERAALVSSLFQETPPPWPFTVAEMAAQGRFYRRSFFGASAASPADRLAVEDALKSACLEGFEERPVTELSGGEMRRVLIARLMAQGAAFLLMDEPTGSLDLKYQIMVMDLIRGMTERGVGALVSLHDLSLAARYASRIAVLSGGKLEALGKPKEILQKDFLSRVFEAPPSFFE